MAELTLQGVFFYLYLDSLAQLHFTRWTETCKTQCFIRVLQACPTLTCLHCGHYRPLRMPCFLLLFHYHQSSLCSSHLMKHIDICYFNFHINAALIPWALTFWLTGSAHIFLRTWTKGEQNHKTSCGCGKHKWKPEDGLKSRRINSFTRKGRHHISAWC